MAAGNFSAGLRRLKTPALVIVVLLGLYAMAGFWLVPALVKWKLPDLVREHTGREGSIRDISLNPFLLTLDLRGLEISRKKGGKFVAFEQFFIDLEVSSVTRKAITFNTILLKQPYVAIDLYKSGEFNFSDLIPESDDEPEEEEEEDGPVPVWVTQLEISEGKVLYRDESRGSEFDADISPINLSVNDFSTYLEKGSNYQFHATLGDGGSLDWNGTFSLAPLSSSGAVAFSGIKPVLLWEYLRDQVQFRIFDGAFDFSAKYAVEQQGDALQATLEDGNYQLKNFKLGEKGSDAALIDIPLFALEGVSLNLLEERIQVNQLRSEGGRIHGWVNPDKQMNFQALFSKVGSDVQPLAQDTQTPVDPKTEQEPATETVAQPKAEAATGGASTAAAEGAAPDPSAAGWVISVAALLLDGYDILFEDRSLKTPVKLQFTPFRLTLKDFKSDLKNPLPMTMDSAINGDGHLKVDGKLGLNPVATDVNLDVKLDLVDFQPYIEPVTRFGFKKGVVQVKGKVDFQLDEQNKPRLTYNGMAAVEDFSGVDRSTSKELLAWNALKFDGVDFSLEPMKVGIGRINVDKARVKFTINQDGSNNIAKVFQGKPAKKSAAKAPATASGSAPPDVRIKSIRVRDAAAEFADRSVKPRFSTSLSKLTGTINGISTRGKSQATIDLKGKADKTAPVTISGKLNPMDPNRNTRVALKFRNLSLTSMSPYSGKFAGYKIKKGKLKVDLDYRVKRNKLVAKNRVVIDQLTLGDQVDSPNAVSLPLSLAIALLKDANGVINLDIPLKGSLDNPEFSIWGTVGDVLVNLLTKVVTSPFTALGSLVGGGDEDLGNVAFAPASSELAEAQQEQLQRISGALAERPALRLEIEGVASMADAAAGARIRFREQLLQQKIREMDADEVAGAKPELTETEYRQGLLLAYYREVSGIKDLDADAEEITNNLNSEETIKKAETTLFSAKKNADTGRLRELAQARGRTIRESLIALGLNPDRVFLLDASIDENGAEDQEQVVSRMTLTAE